MTLDSKVKTKTQKKHTEKKEGTKDKEKKMTWKIGDEVKTEIKRKRK